MTLRTRIAIIVTTVAYATTLGVVSAPPASAATPVVVSPPNGGSLPAGSSGPIVIDFTPNSGNYWVAVKCGNFDYYWSTGGFVPYSGQRAIVIDPLEGFGGEDLGGATCELDAFGGSPYTDITSTFTVASPPLTMGEVTVTKPEFYPIVKDKYLDETEFVFDVNRKADAMLTVTDRDGKVVYTRSIWAAQSGEYRIPWKGQTRSGRPVKPGIYRATITVTADGTSVSQSARVRVSTKVALRRLTLRKDELGGRETTGGNCRVEYEDRGTLLDCWGGAYARSTFTFKIPSNATNIRWGARTSSTLLDRGRGSITKTGTRASKTTFQIRVQATGWRAVYVHGAFVTFRARIQI